MAHYRGIIQEEGCMTNDTIREGEAITADGAVSFATKLRSIAGLDPELVAKLAEVGISDNAGLLARGAQPAGRDEICASAGVDAVKLLRALYMMDLERIDGVSWTNATLLTTAGVTTVPDLAFRVAEDLVPQIQQANAELSLVKRLPSAKTIKSWIDHAKTLPSAIFFEGNAEVF
jgi:predicted flap endonuclease-1-like 5' DNA nuclease